MSVGAGVMPPVRDSLHAAPRARQVGIGAVKYADLAMNRNSNYKFSFDKMLSLSGNTAPYMLYAYARVRGIQRRVATRLVELGQLPTGLNVDDLTLEGQLTKETLLLSLVQLSWLLLPHSLSPRTAPSSSALA